MDETASHPVKSLEKSIDVIEFLNDETSAPLRDIADGLGMNKSTVHNHLSTLRERGYVVQDGDEYRLSLQFLHIGGVMRNEVELYNEAKSQVDELAAKTDELVTLATREGPLAIVLYRAKGENAVTIDTHMGSKVTLHNSALGKVILAHLPESEATAIIDEQGLPAETPNTITDRETLLAELADIREQGFALDDEEKWRGLRCIAAPILSDSGEIQGAISLSAPKGRVAMDAERNEYIEDMKNTANLIELSITYS